MSYLTSNGVDPSTFVEATQNTMFNYYPEEKTTQAIDIEAIQNARDELAWDDASSALSDLFSNFVEWWDSASGEYGSYVTAITDKVSTIVGTGIDYASAEVHVVLEEEIKTLLGDADYVLPAFNELGYDYLSGEVTRRFDDYVGVSGYTGILRDISESNYVKEYLYDDAVSLAKSTEYWEYIPTWMTQMDWLKLPASYQDYKLEFSADHVSVYFLSKNDSLSNMRTITGLETLIQVETFGDTPITDQTEDFYIYKAVVFSGDDIDLSGFNDAAEDASDLLSGILIDADSATISAQ